VTPLVTTFDPDVGDARVERAAFAMFREFIRDDARAEFRWSKLTEIARRRWLNEARAALEAAA